jgi:hypothetical protein
LYARIETEGWELEDVEEAALKHPNTFKIPTRSERTNLKVGDFVKLIFLIALKDEEGNYLQGERIYVQVTEIVGEGYRGRLTDKPVSSDTPALNATITFGPEHVATRLMREPSPRDTGA